MSSVDLHEAFQKHPIVFLCRVVNPAHATVQSAWRNMLRMDFHHHLCFSDLVEPTLYGYAETGIRVMNVETKALITAGRHPLAHLQIPIRVAEGRYFMMAADQWPELRLHSCRAVTGRVQEALKRKVSYYLLTVFPGERGPVRPPPVRSAFALPHQPPSVQPGSSCSKVFWSGVRSAPPVPGIISKPRSKWTSRVLMSS